MSEGAEKMGESARAGSAGSDLDELVRGLGAMSESEARAVLDRIAGEKGSGAVPLLEGLAARLKPALAVITVQTLGAVREAMAASALQRLSEALSGEARKAARRELHRLATRGIHPAAGHAPAGEKTRAGAVWPVYRALASLIDGAGNRGIWIAFDRGPEADLLTLLLDEEKGIMDVHMREGMDRTRFDRQAGKLSADQEMLWIEMPVDYVRHLVQEAHARNAASGTPLALEYLAWRERLGRPEKEYEQPLVYSVINAAEVRWDPRNLDKSGQLFSLPMIQGWVIDRADLVELVREREAARRSGLVLAGATGEARERMAVDGAIHKLFGPRRRALLKRRLEETAYVLWKRDRIPQARLAMAAAMALEPSDRSLANHPFVRTMVEESIEYAGQQLLGQRTRTIKPGVKLYLP